MGQTEFTKITQNIQLFKNFLKNEIKLLLNF